MGKVIDVMSLYPKDMNIYGDSGNVLVVLRRLALYGYEPRLHAYNQGDEWPERVDMILGGGGQDTGQKKITGDLFKRAGRLRDLAADGTPMLMICGLFQLFGEYFETSEGERLDGINVLGAYTVGQSHRMIGNLVEHSDEFGDVIGYENHSGQTFLREGTLPLGHVDHDGTGNNGEDHTEGARVGNVIGTYMHGSLLPKNPAVVDFLIRAAVTRRYGEFEPDQSSEQMFELARLDALADMVTFRQESVFHHTFLFLFRTLTLNSYVGIIIITIHSISSRTSHLSGESSYESFISGWFTYFSLFYIGKEFIQVHYIHVPVFFFFPADKHTIRFISQKSTAQVRSFRSLNNLTGGHFNKVNLCRSPFTFFSVRKRTFHLFVISTAGRPEQ